MHIYIVPVNMLCNISDELASFYIDSVLAHWINIKMMPTLTMICFNGMTMICFKSMICFNIIPLVLSHNDFSPSGKQPEWHLFTDML